MLQGIEQLRVALGLSEGGLLKLAREIAHDGALLSVRHMRASHKADLLAFLEKAAAHEAKQEMAAR